MTTGQAGAEDGRATLAGTLATLAATLLLASEISDGLERQVGLSLFSLVFALILATLLVCLGLILGYDLLQWPRLQRHKPSRAKTTVALLGLGAGTLTLIAIEHLHRLPAADGWLGTAGGLLMLAAALANHDTGRHRPLGT